MQGSGENDGGFGGNDANAATLQALGRAYASLAPQGNNNNTNNNGGGNGGFPFGVDVSSLLGVSSATAVATVAAVAAKHLAQQQQGQTSTPAPAGSGGLTAQQLSALSAVLGQQQNNQAPSAASLPASLLSSLSQGTASNNNAASNVQALLKSVAAAQAQGQGQHLNGVGNQHHQAQTNNFQSAVSGPQHQPPTPASYTPPPFQQQQQQQPHQPPKPAPAHSQNSAFDPSSQMVGTRGAATHTAAPPNAMKPNQMPTHHNIQNWSLGQLEQHIKLLQQIKQPIPQSIALLLADARRKEDKKNAKRVANRKSACTSRARKKALVEEMTRTNARLKRQALILSLLPDLVIAISQEGEITFCSAQVERMLQHKIDDLVGANIQDILIPESQAAMSKLVEEMVNPGEATKGAQKQDVGNQPNNGLEAEKKADGNGMVSAEASSGSGGVSSGAAAVVSNQSFPLEVVNVQSKEEPALDENDNSDTSAGGGKGAVISSLSNSTPRSPSASFANSGSDPDDGAKGSKEAAEGKERLSPTSKAQRLSSSDDSSSGSTETKNIRKANENLERNVRWHNKKLQNMSKTGKAKSHTDDVLGDSVTPNNALARLSSLQHYPEAKPAKKGDKIRRRSPSEDDLMDGVEETVEEKKKDGSNENASDDSGYRESNDSREETSSSESESSNSNGRKKPLAPTCNVCLIRDDLTTLWCEVTSSMRTRTVDGESPEDNSSAHSVKVGSSKTAAKQSAGSKTSKSSTISSDEESQGEPKTHEVKELLLCLRPIRDGDGKVDQSLRFVPGQSWSGKSISPVPSGNALEGLAVAAAAGGLVSERTDGEQNSFSAPSSSNDHARAVTESSGSIRKGPPKKRPLQGSAQESGSASKRSRCMKRSATNTEVTEKSAVESLMLMSNKTN